MLKRRRTARLPDSFARHLDGERSLVAAELAGDGWAVVTKPALVVVGEEGVRLRAPWHHIENGKWDGDARTFTITWSDRGRPEEVLTLADDDVERFTTSLRERVQSSVIHAETLTLAGGQVRATVRRDEDGSLYSQLTAFGTLTGTDDEQRQIDELERRARRAVGLPE
ncbi:hypothetical protein [Georgenia faecalis]|uniref:Uncharacterized protein n=1 Tax=Georgenia faecalis TaxID=2483799 RepID=A0ABV9DAL1_9MICO|nr:hypothetical protein [Georgenia faecalis]